MKIDKTLNSREMQIQNSRQMNRSGTKGPEPVQPMAHQGRQDRVELSSQAKEIMNAQKIAAAIPDVREDLVGQIKNQMQTGAYRIDTDKIASGLLDDTLTNQMALK